MIKNELPYSKEDYYVGAQGNPELNIDITANGDYDVRKYSTATVNVSGGGGGDFTSANVTLICNASNEVIVELPMFEEANPPFNPNAHSFGSISLYDGDEYVMSAILYKGIATGIITGASNITGSGDVVVNNNIVTITGDCTITIS